MIRFLRSWIFNIYFLTFTPVSLLMMALLLPLPRGAMVAAVSLWSRTMLGAIRWLVGITYKVESWDKMPPEPCLIACKHQSAWDTMVFFDLIEDPIYVLKIELMKLPVYGWLATKCKAIGIDRQSGAAGLRKMIKDTQDTLAEGRYVIIFPEGTRTDPGEKVTYHSGVAALYRQLDVPVVPVALNSGNFWGRYQWVKTPGEITLQILDPIPPGLAPRDMLKRLEADIEGACAALPNPKIRDKTEPAQT
ncbi:MAG: lysophospholipid acyltransferase family protein [Rhodospirillales bacterium]